MKLDPVLENLLNSYNNSNYPIFPDHAIYHTNNTEYIISEFMTFSIPSYYVNYKENKLRNYFNSEITIPLNDECHFDSSPIDRVTKRLHEITKAKFREAMVEVEKKRYADENSLSKKDFLRHSIFLRVTLPKKDLTKNRGAALSGFGLKAG